MDVTLPISLETDTTMNIFINNTLTTATVLNLKDASNDTITSGIHIESSTYYVPQNANDLSNISVSTPEFEVLRNSSLTEDIHWISNNFTAEDYLQHLNDQFASLVLPAIIVLGMLMVLGVIGNSFVLYVYTLKMKGGTITRFIQALAVFDLLSCCVAIPGEIIDMRSNYTFGKHSMCKIVRTVNLFCTVASGCSLVVVAIDRYKRICCPLRRQIAPKGALIIMCCCAVTSLVISLPTAAIYGSRTISTDVISINGSDCSTSDRFIDTMFPLAYNGLQMLLFFIGAIILMVLYTLIAKRIFHHAHLRQKRRRSVKVGRIKYNRECPSFISYPTSSSEPNCPIVSDFPSNGISRRSVKNNWGSVTKHEDNLKKIPAVVPENGCLNNARVSKEKGGIHFQSQVNGGDVTDVNGPLRELSTDDRGTNRKSENGSSNLTNDIDKSDHLIETNDNKDISLLVESTSIEQENINTQTPARDSNISSIKADRSLIEASTPNGNPDSCNQDTQDSNGSNNNTQSPASTISDTTSQSTESPPFSVTIVDSDDAGLNSTNCETETESYSSDHSTTMSPPETPIDELDNPERGLLTSFINKNNCSKTSRKCHLNSTPFRNCKSNAKQKGCGSVIRSKVLLQPVQENDTKCQENCSVTSDLDENQNTDSSFTNRYDQHKKLSDSSECSLQMRRREKGTAEGDSARLKRHSFAVGSSATSDKSRKRVLFTNSSFGGGDKKENYSHRKSKDGNTQGTEADDEEEDNFRRRKRRRSSLRGLKDLKNLALRSDTPGTRRTTLMLFLITLVYILSFLPHLVLMTIKALDENSLSGNGGAWELANNLLIRSYFINSVANPIIYGFFSKNFFKECKNCLK